MNYEMLIKRCGKAKIDRSTIFFTHPCGIQYNPRLNVYFELKDKKGNMIFRKVTETYAKKRMVEFHVTHPEVPIDTTNMTITESCFGIDCGHKTECGGCRVKSGCERKFNMFRTS